MTIFQDMQLGALQVGKKNMRSVKLCHSALRYCLRISHDM